MADNFDKLHQLLSRGPQKPRQLLSALDISQPTLSRLLARLGPELVRLGAARAVQYALRDRYRAVGEVPVYRINRAGQIQRLGLLIAIRPDGFVMQEDNGASLHSDGLPWWLLDMRPQGFLGRAYAHRHAFALGLPIHIQHWSDTDALRALLSHGHDAVGNLLLGDSARAHFLAQTAPGAITEADKAARYVELAEQATQGDFPVSSAAGEQPKFTAYAHTPAGPTHVLVKFSLAQNNPITQRWRDLLLAEHLALETLREAGINAVRSWLHDHQGQHFLEVERFDRVGVLGRRGLISLTALDAEFIGKAHQPWPVLVHELVQQKIVHADAAEATQVLYAFGRLIGNTDMHAGNLSFLNDDGRPYALAPAYDMLPMGFQPKSGGGLDCTLPPLDFHPSVAARVWHHVLPIAQCYLDKLCSERHFSAEFATCVQSLTLQLEQARQRIALLG